MRRPAFFIVAILLAVATSCTTVDPAPRVVTLSIISTSDTHGELAARDDRGGLVTISGYVNAIRDIRSRDGGLLLIDAGDMWQGTLESNLNEGAAVVAAYNAMDYDAAAIGNHEFDFGPAGANSIPTDPGDDPRGALKQRAVEAEFPLLAANLIDTDSDSAVEWPNVQPSVRLDTAGISVGIIGVMTSEALPATIAANVQGLRVAPLAATIEKEARNLRQAGAHLVIVTAHAGGRCEQFDSPTDLSSCNQKSEIFEVAKALPTGLVDHIIAGHTHQGIAHMVNGIAITSSFANSNAFGRVDFTMETISGKVLKRRIFPPQRAAPGQTYEGKPVEPDATVVAIAARAARVVNELKKQPVGVYLEDEFGLTGSPDSPLGKLFTQALLESFDVDIVILNVVGGMRSHLPAGELTYGRVYEMTPFDNRAVVLALSGAQLRTIVAENASRGQFSVGFAGLHAAVRCENNIMRVTMTHADGNVIGDDDQLRVLTSDYIALGGSDVLTTIMPRDGFAVDANMPFVRDALVSWFGAEGGSLKSADYGSNGNPMWQRPMNLDSTCKLPKT